MDEAHRRYEARLAKFHATAPSCPWCKTPLGSSAYLSDDGKRYCNADCAVWGAS